MKRSWQEEEKERPLSDSEIQMTCATLLDRSSCLESHDLEPESLGALPPASRAFLAEVLRFRLVAPSSVSVFLDERSERLTDYTTAESLGNALVQANLLTSYQVDRLLAGTTHGLLLGNYRILRRLGAGGMGVVFLGEHCLMNRRVAIKVLPVDDDCPMAVRKRFYSEMRVLAGLHHPHIVEAFDAGELPPSDLTKPPLIYLVMELIPGGDLENYVLTHGRLSIAQACDWIRQAACGLQEAHDHHLIHRDVKPSNLLRTERNQIKVVDFGLAREFCSRLTDPRSLLGSLDFMAPEQSCDPTLVASEADIYSLGATLFWLLAGEPPYPPAKSVAAALRNLQHEQPRRLRMFRPDVPPELEELVAHLLDHDIRRRPAIPLAVMNALTPFVGAPSSLAWVDDGGHPGPGPAAPRKERLSAVIRSSPGAASEATVSLSGRVLIVDDDRNIRKMSRLALEMLGCDCREAEDGEAALEAVHQETFDLLLLDLNLPGTMGGYEVCRRLRERPPVKHLKIIVVSGCGDQNALAETLPRGADDYIPKPFGPRQLQAKVEHALRLKEAQDRADLLAHHLQLTNRQLEQSLAARAADVRQTQDALLLAMAKMAESEDGETSEHLRRLQLYTRCLAEAAASDPAWAGLVNEPFLEDLERCVPLHDIGKIGLPDAILHKLGVLTPEERDVVEMHTVIGDRMLEGLGREHGKSLPFLRVARAIVRHHHERYDGGGYPDQLAGDAIPAVARLVAIADVYDALRRKRCHKPALPHADTARILLEESAGQFDPILLKAFAARQEQFERIYRDMCD